MNFIELFERQLSIKISEGQSIFSLNKIDGIGGGIWFDKSGLTTYIEYLITARDRMQHTTFDDPDLYNTGPDYPY